MVFDIIFTVIDIPSVVVSAIITVYLARTRLKNGKNNSSPASLWLSPSYARFQVGIVFLLTSGKLEYISSSCFGGWPLAPPLVSQY